MSTSEEAARLGAQQPTQLNYVTNVNRARNACSKAQQLIMEEGDLLSASTRTKLVQASAQLETELSQPSGQAGVQQQGLITTIAGLQECQVLLLRELLIAKKCFATLQTDFNALQMDLDTAHQTQIETEQYWEQSATESVLAQGRLEGQLRQVQAQLTATQRALASHKEQLATKERQLAAMEAANKEQQAHAGRQLAAAKCPLEAATNGQLAHVEQLIAVKCPLKMFSNGQLADGEQQLVATKCPAATVQGAIEDQPPMLQNKGKQQAADKGQPEAAECQPAAVKAAKQEQVATQGMQLAADKEQLVAVKCQLPAVEAVNKEQVSVTEKQQAAQPGATERQPVAGGAINKERPDVQLAADKEQLVAVKCQLPAMEDSPRVDDLKLQAVQ